MRTVPGAWSRWLAVAAGAIAALLLPAAASGAGWTGPETLSATGGAPALAVDHDGKAVVVWTYREFAQEGVQADVHPLGGTGWNPLDAVGPAHICLAAGCLEDYLGYGGAVVGIDAGGDALAVWDTGGHSGEPGTRLGRPALRRTVELVVLR